MEEFVFRAAGLDDLDAIVRLHLRSWRQSMKDLAPPAAYAALDESYRTGQWTRMLGSPGADDLWLVCESGDALIGVGGACAPTHASFEGRGEIRFLYIDPSWHRQGVGRQILSRLARHLIERGYKGVALSVVEGNVPARAFYGTLGGREIGFHTFPSKIWPSVDVIISWDDATQLASMT